MSDITEALGTAAEGGLLAKAVSKGGTPVEKGHFAEGACLNCGTQLNGKHCHECGQKAHLHRTIGAFVHDLLHGALHLDGKVWRTLPLLILKPGKLTRRYIEGERTSFVSPMALFLFSVFLMFAVFQALGISTPTDIRGDTAAQMRALAAAEIRDLEQNREDALEMLSQEGVSAAEREELQKQVSDFDQRLEGIRQAQEDLPFLDTIFGPENGDAEGRNPASVETGADGDTSVPLNDDGTARMTIDRSGVDWIDEAFEKWRTNPGLMLYKLQANAYKFSWLLIPLSIPFVWLLFAWKRRFKAYDHAIFVTYSITFVSLLFITLSLLAAAGIGGGWVFLALAILPPLHLYKHLKYAYDLSRFGAIWRLTVLHVFILVILLLFFQVLLLLGGF